jgi:hypothetical protein
VPFYSDPSYWQAKSALSLPGAQIHHVVEQCQTLPTRSGFSPNILNSTDNLIRLPKDIHTNISAFYSSSVPGTNITVRDSLNGLPFQEQFDFGMGVVNQAIAGTLR